MIVWLASYPRSGNTLTRLILREVFGVKSYSKHYLPRPPQGGNGSGAMRELEVNEPLPGKWAEVYGPMSQAAETAFVKTHDGPDDDQKAVYIVRNGFASVLSYRHFLRDVAETERTLEEIIAGFTGFGSWGCHLDLWNPLQRPRTLLVKYEDLLHSPDEQIQRLAAFFELKPLKSWNNDFSRFQSLNPKLFRQGRAEDVSLEFDETGRQLFWTLHGDWMARLGYSKSLPEKMAVAQPLLRQFLAQRTQAQAVRQLRRQLEEADSLRAHWWTRLGRKLGAVSWVSQRV